MQNVRKIMNLLEDYLGRFDNPAETISLAARALPPEIEERFFEMVIFYLQELANDDSRMTTMMYHHREKARQIIERM